MTTLHRSSSDGIGIDTKDTDVDLVPAALKRAAEAEMRRSLPSHLPSHDQRPLKKQKSAQDYVHLPRYDYSAAQDLESGGVVGFIASCAFRREKSATREAIQLLTRYLVVHSDAQTATSPLADANHATKLFSIIKMSTRGAVLLRLLRPAGTGTDALAHALVAIKAVESLLQDLDCGAIPPPKHVFRIIPFASTCRLGKESLEVCARQVSTIATTIIRQRKNGTPTFGIAVHNRDQQTSTRHVNSRATYNDGDCVALSRKDVIDAVATGLTRGLAEGHAHCHAIKELKVDLSDPTIVISVEMVPIMGRVYAGISLLPRSICSTKPKLAVKSLR